MKHQISNQSKTLLTLTALSLATVVARIIATQEVLYLFLVWNLFLAGLPYMFAKISARQKNAAGFGVKTLFFMGLWLLFLPNSFYIVTDFIHIKRSQSHLIYLDLLTIASFAITGLMYGYYAIQTIRRIVAPHLTKGYLSLATLTIYILCGFGIYLGRVLRWNSWDIITDPTRLLYDISAMLLSPSTHKLPWAMTLGFGFFLFTLDWVMQRYTVSTKQNDA